MAVVGGQVSASEYNGYVTRINAILGIGSGQTGYGFTPKIDKLQKHSVTTASISFP